MKKYLTSLILLTAFILWIVPLGAFIEQSKEEELCFGKRAICMCSQTIARMNKLNRIGMLQSGQGLIYQLNGSSSLSPKFIAYKQFKLDDQKVTIDIFDIESFYSFYLIDEVDHVPKV